MTDASCRSFAVGIGIAYGIVFPEVLKFMNHQFPLLLLLLSLGSCIYHPPAVSKDSTEPFIDSTGFKAAQSRINATEWEESSSLISQALSVMGDTVQAGRQADFFQSLEENYQKYLTLFTPAKQADPPEVHCGFDLIETFRLAVFDPQPFLNAILHTMTLTDLATLDYVTKPQGADTTLVLVKATRAEHPGDAKSLTFKEGDVTLSVTRHGAVLMNLKIEQDSP